MSTAGSKAMGKVLLLIVDGVGDVAIPALADRTPLEVAHTPFMDAVAGVVSCGCHHQHWPGKIALRAMTHPVLAHAPHAAAGLNGLVDPVEPGLACGSDTAHMSILGTDPRR